MRPVLTRGKAGAHAPAPGPGRPRWSFAALSSLSLPASPPPPALGRPVYCRALPRRRRRWEGPPGGLTVQDQHWSCNFPVVWQWPSHLTSLNCSLFMLNATHRKLVAQSPTYIKKKKKIVSFSSLLYQTGCTLLGRPCFILIWLPRPTQGLAHSGSCQSKAY